MASAGVSRYLSTSTGKAAHRLANDDSGAIATCAGRGHSLSAVCARCRIRHIAVCAALDAQELRDLAAIMIHRRLSPHQSLVMEGEHASHAYNVISGGLKLYKSLPDGRTQAIGFLFAGDFLGLPLRGLYRYSAESLSETALCQYPSRPLQAVFKAHPQLQERIVAGVYDELAAAHEHMLLLGRKTARQRLSSFLLALARRAELTGSPMDTLAIPLHRNEIAEYLGLTIETVSRNFTELRKHALIELVRHDQIQITDRARLETIAEGA